MAVSGDQGHAAVLLGDRRGGTVLAPYRAQVQHLPRRRPQKCVGDGKAPTIGVPGLTHANDAAELVDIVGAAGPSSERPQVDDPGLLRPEESATTSTHHRTAVVDPERYA